MSTSAVTPPKFEWLVVVPDTPGALAKRLEVRPTHFANLGPNIASGKITMGGAILSDVPADPADPSTYAFAGSSLVVVASSRDEVLQLLRSDVYGQAGVWDVEKAQMWPFKCALRTAIELPK